ncbi:MAG TPA: nucleotidyl transferase AbiEii/AbiGii toxin family protein [Pyrinomonadaceae bacterium]|nr:nucleotidyl transferase AbiEii/AbiGii toxin family protein [Pyrinomonadaceae bacterium]
MLDIYDEFRNLVAELEEHEIDYALCGGMAMAVHGRPRMTIDIDILVQPESLDRVMAIANRLNYKVRGLDMSFANGAVEIRRISKIDPESGDLLPLDLLLVTPQLRVVWESRIDSEWEGRKLSVVSRSGLVALKRLRGSGQDLDDIKTLEEGERGDQS